MRGDMKSSSRIVPWGSLTTEPSVDIWEVKGQKRGDGIIQGKPCMHVTTVSKPWKISKCLYKIKPCCVPKLFSNFFIIFRGRHIRHASQRISHDTHSSCGRLYYDRNKSGTARKMVDKKNTSSPTSGCQWWWWYALGRNNSANCHLPELMVHTNSSKVLRTAWVKLTLLWKGNQFGLESMIHLILVRLICTLSNTDWQIWTLSPDRWQAPLEIFCNY